MDKESEEKAVIAHFTRPWSQRRGLESMESHGGSILVAASIDELTKALTPIAVETYQDVLNNEVIGGSCSYLTYQIIGQRWSVLLPDWIFFQQQFDRCSRPDAARLSALLGKAVIEITVSDTVGAIGYQLFEAGELVEYFSGSEEEDPFAAGADANIEAQYYELSPYPDEEEPLTQFVRVWSRNRSLSAQDIDNMWSFPDKFLRAQNAYDPAFDMRHFFGTHTPDKGKRYQIKNPGITLVIEGYLPSNNEVTAMPEFIRVDYFKFAI